VGVRCSAALGDWEVEWLDGPIARAVFVAAARPNSQGRKQIGMSY